MQALLIMNTEDTMNFVPHLFLVIIISSAILNYCHCSYIKAQLLFMPLV